MSNTVVCSQEDLPMSDTRVRPKRGPDLRPRRSKRSTSSVSQHDIGTRFPKTEVQIAIGGLYVLEGRLIRVDRQDSDGRIVVEDQIDGTERRVFPGMLTPRPIEAMQGTAPVGMTDGNLQADPGAPISCLSDAQKNVALERLGIIQPLVDLTVRSEQDVIRAARQSRRSARTIYRWLSDYLANGLSALAPQRRGVSVGTVRLDPRVEQIVDTVIRKAFAAGESSVAVSDVRAGIYTACDRLSPDDQGRTARYPGDATIQRRLSKMRPIAKNHTGETERLLRDLQRPVTGSIGATRVLHIVEIDHTVIDVHAIDDETLEPIGRPTLTVAIDDFTRCVLGFVLTLVPPSALAAALCLQRMRFPKETWLKELGLERLEWPMYGRPDIVQTDHGKEFVAPGFRYGCQRMNSAARTRPKAKPRYGGTIERVIGTLMRKFRLLPGATYIDMLKRATRKPTRDACYTLAGLEWEVVREIGRYHDTRHDSLGMTPRQAWDKALAARGSLAPPIPTISPELFVIDFMPRIERTVSRKGIEFGGRLYWAEALEPLIPLRKVVFVRPDPRNVRHLWIELPDDKGYVRSNLYQPRDFIGTTLWDYRAWCRRRRGPPILNHAVHADLLDESRERRAQAATRVKAHRSTAKTVTQTRRTAVQNRMFQAQARCEGAGSAQDATHAAEPAHAESSGRPQLTLVRTTPSEPDLSRLKATPGYVFRRNPRQR
jgi:putative transposase